MSSSSNSKTWLIPLLLCICLCFLAALFYIHVNGNRYNITTYMENKGALVLDKKTGNVWRIYSTRGSMVKLMKEVPAKTTDKKTTVKKDTTIKPYTVDQLDKDLENFKNKPGQN